MYEHLQGAREQYFVRCGERSHPDRSSIEFYDHISPGQKLQTHTQTDGNDIQPHTAQKHSERTSTEFNLVTAQSTAHEPPEDGRTYGPKHVGSTSLKCFKNDFKCFKY
jgi:hypothetical protein